MIERTLEQRLHTLATQFPVITLTGPRQSGKTTLSRMAFPDKPYVSLEAMDTRQWALEDPRGFLRQYEGGAIIDEVQRAPLLTSYLQGMVDEDPTEGRFILTGSRNFSVMEAVSQSLAGRTAILQLMPFSLDEVTRHEGARPERSAWLLRGGYPAIYDRALDARSWLDGYVRTYLERDVRQVLSVGDLLAFQRFVKLCAGRAGQLVNLSGLGGDTGVSHNTVKSWLSVLEAGYIVFRLSPWYRNTTKRLVKAPKLYFYDTGLLCFLLDITTDEQLFVHPLRGAIFENHVVTEVLKAYLNAGLTPPVSFYRNRSGLEVDLLVERGTTIEAVEIKSAETVDRSLFGALTKLTLLPGFESARKTLVHGGHERYQRSGVTVLPWYGADSLGSSS